jgi:plasmid stabilization system protein ParE
MAKEVVLTHLAATDYENVTDYLIANWGINVTNRFIERLEQIRMLLAENPRHVSIC